VTDKIESSSFSDAIEINDIMFFVKNLRDPSQSFNVMDFVEFCSGSTRSSTFLKLKQRMSKFNSVKHFCFNYVYYYVYYVYGTLYLLWTQKIL